LSKIGKALGGFIFTSQHFEKILRSETILIVFAIQIFAKRTKTRKNVRIYLAKI